MWFISRFNEYCDCKEGIPSLLRRNESLKELDQLSNLYKESNKSDEDEFLVDKLISYKIVGEGRDEQILKRNLIKVIEELYDKNLISLYIIEKIRGVLISKIQEYQKQNNLTYSKVFAELYLFFHLSPELNEVESIFSEALTIDWYDGFFYYCIKSENNRRFFNILLEKYIKLFEVTVANNRYEYFFLWEDKCINYIAINKETNTKFLNLLSKNPETLKSLFDWYYSERKKFPFLRGNSLDVQNCIWTLINEYYWKKIYKDDRIFKQNLFQLVIKSQFKETEFVYKVLTYLNDEKRQYFSVTPIILKALLNGKNIDKFLKFKRWNRTILGLFYSLKSEWNQVLSGKIYQKYQAIIDKNDEYIQQSRWEITEEEKKIKQDIKEIIDNNIQLKETTKQNYFVSSILYLYKDHKNLFEDYQKSFVKDQIYLYLTSNNTNPWNPERWIEYIKENSFSWPWFIQDLELCIEISLSENIDLTKYKERIIYLIPYLFDWDYRKLLEGFDENLNITDNKLINWILDVYSHKNNKGLWYFHPSRLISLFDDNIFSTKDFDSKQIKQLSEICKTMIQSKESRITVGDKKSYCDFLIKNRDERIDAYWMINYHEEEMKKYEGINYFDNYLRHNINDKGGFEMFVEINEALILLFKDKNAINWQFSQLLWIKEDFEEIEYTWVHWISELERELIYWNYDNEFFYTVLTKVLKYPENINEINSILNNAQNLWDKSLFKRYLHNFVASYYKNIPEEDKAEIYANIDDKDFVIYYLWVSNWDDLQKARYKVEKKNRNIQILEGEIDNYKKWFKTSESIIQEKEKKIEILQEEKNYLEHEVVIITEWKTDRKILKTMAIELKKEAWDEDIKIYDFFLKWIHEYENMEAWDKRVFSLIKDLAELFPKKYFIWIFDTDWILKRNGESDSYLKQLKEVWDYVYEFGKGPKNVRIIKLTEPRWYRYKRNAEYYNNSWWSIELLYNKSRLSKYFFVPRDCNLEEIACYPDRIFKGKYKYNTIYTKDTYSTIYSKDNVPPIICTNEEKTKIIKKLITKNDFAEGIKNCTIAIPIKECKIFSKLFKVIYDTYKNMEEEDKNESYS